MVSMKQIGRRATARLILVVWLALQTGIIAAPVSTSAQTEDFPLFGFNLIGTPPLMHKTREFVPSGFRENIQSVTSGEMRTPDNRLMLHIPAGTFIRNAASQPQEFISATLVAEPLAAAAHQVLIAAYALGTPGAVFNPTVGLTFTYQDSELPPSAAEDALYIAEWNGSNWNKLSGIVDLGANTVSTTIASFTTYGLFANAQPQVTTTTDPTPTLPTTQHSQVTTPAIATTPAGDSDAGGDSPVSPVLFIVGGAVVLLIIILVSIANKK
jgi:hypothetical protein